MILVSVIAALSILVGAEILIVGTIVSITKDCVFCHSAPVILSSALIVIVPEFAIPLRVQVTGLS